MSDVRSPFNLDQSGGTDTIPGLLRNLADQGSHLAQQQVNLVQAEVRQSVADLKLAIGAMAGAAVVGLAGLGVLLMGLAFLLSEVLPLWAATLIVAAVSLAGAYLLFLRGSKKIAAGGLNVDRTKRTLERAPGAISGQNEGRFS
jgi:hypothetical protein